MVYLVRSDIVCVSSFKIVYGAILLLLIESIATTKKKGGRFYVSFGCLPFLLYRAKGIMGSRIWGSQPGGDNRENSGRFSLALRRAHVVKKKIPNFLFYRLGDIGGYSFLCCTCFLSISSWLATFFRLLAKVMNHVRSCPVALPLRFYPILFGLLIYGAKRTIRPSYVF